jgi:regulator of sigma E protease
VVIIGIIIAILILGVLILVHELGHFIMARATGIAVDEFAIGFGKELFGWQKGETRYRINLIPLGGYCKMRGEESEDRKTKEQKLKEALQDEEERKDIKKDPHAMYNRPAWARVLAILGGPVFNYIFAILIFSILFMAGIKEEFEDFTIRTLATNTSGAPTPAVKAGLKNGDRLLSINGKQVVNYRVVMEQFGLNVETPLEVVYQRGNTTNTVTVTPEYNEETGLGVVGLYRLPEPIAWTVDKRSPAQKAGFKSGDVILNVDGNRITSMNDLGRYITNTAETYQVSVRRGDSNLVIKVQPQQEKDGLYLGISAIQVKKRYAKNFFHAFAMGFRHTNITLKEQIWGGLKKMFAGKINVQKNISGPIRIIQYTTKVTMYSDFNRVLQFMALISVALGFFNLLPIPGLDGAHFLINTFEMVTTIKPSEKVMTVIEYVGFFIIIGLSILVVGNDLFNIISEWFSRS